MLRRFLIIIVLFLLVVVAVADRVGAIVAGHVLAGKVQTDEGLKNRPSVTIKGIPFLTQAIGGKYSDVHLTDNRVVLNGVPITTLTVDLRGLHLSIGNAVKGSVSQVPVDRVTGTAFVSFADANAYLAHHVPGGTSIRLRAGPDPRSVTITDRVRLDGSTFVLGGTGAISVAGNVVSVDATGLAPKQGSPGSALIAQALRLAKISFPLQSLPFQLSLTGITVDSTGLTGTGVASNVVLGSHH